MHTHNTQRVPMHKLLIALSCATLTATLATGGLAQDPTGLDIPQGDSNEGFNGLAAGRVPKVDIPWNRFQDMAGLYALMDRIATAHPGFMSFEVIGTSVEGRELRVYTLTAPGHGAAADKPAMWIDGNIHGNEVQGGEVVVYTAWYLLENYGFNARATDLLDNRSFYLLPSINPDGRDRWFHEANTAHSSRTGVMPIDSDRDGLFDEDGPDDLDGDGSITSMRKYVPGLGDYKLDEDDPRIMVRVEPGKKGDWVRLGQEGIDNDGDGSINEDGVGGYDMNRSWQALWMPEHVQFGAGPYPFYWPETRSIARFFLTHPNIAAVQSFHNNGGMILRGPGAEDFGSYPRADLAIFDELGRDGEKMLPFYRYMVIWKDLYSVFGGEVNWTYEGLGIISFTNELWTQKRISPDDRIDGSLAGRLWADDQLLLGAGFVDWHEYEHPLYGTIEIGGFRKDVGRVPPSFLIEEMLHRNAMFCIAHAEAMPEVELVRSEVTELEGGLFALDITLGNPKAISTRTQMASDKGIGVPDRLTLTAGGKRQVVLAAGFLTDRFHPERLDLIDGDPTSFPLEAGVRGKHELTVRYIVSGKGKLELTYAGEKVRDLSVEVLVD